MKVKRPWIMIPCIVLSKECCVVSITTVKIKRKIWQYGSSSRCDKQTLTRLLHVHYTRILLILFIRILDTICSICLFSSFRTLSEPTRLTIRLICKLISDLQSELKVPKRVSLHVALYPAAKRNGGRECWSWYEYTAALWPGHAIYNWI
jgi:hypothetical protein